MEAGILRDELFREKNARDTLGSAIDNVRTMIEGCSACHHGNIGDEKIREMALLINALKERTGDDAEVRTYVNEFIGIAHDAMLSGEKLASDRAKKTVTDAKRSWRLFVVNLIVGLGIVCSLVLFFIRKFNRGIKNILMATESIRRGERIRNELFEFDLHSVAESMKAMQSDLLIKEEKLINWARQWQIAFNSVDSMMALCDIEGRVIIANNAFHDVFETDRTVEGKALREVVCYEYENVEDCPTVRTLKEGNIHAAIIRSKNMILSVKTFPVKSEGESGISGAIWIGRDITKEKEMEERAIQSEKLVALGELVAGIAHEINNPLSAVVGFSEILKDSGKLGKEEKEKIQKIYSAALRVSRIIGNLLEFSRKRPSVFSKHSINDIADKVIELKKYELRIDNIEIERDFSDVPSVMCDLSQIQQVILNLVNNSHHAITEKGDKGVISIRTYHNNMNVFLAVSDTGAGIPDDIMHRVYEPFFTTKDVGKGTGLGLSIVYSAVNAHGGTIKIESLPGEGSTFTLSLPVEHHNPS